MGAHIRSGCQIEKVVDKLNLTKKIISCHPSNLPLPDQPLQHGVILLGPRRLRDGVKLTVQTPHQATQAIINAVNAPFSRECRIAVRTTRQ